jgi:hypothetical protein
MKKKPLVFIALLLVMPGFIFSVGCAKHKEEVAPVEVKPIHITIDVNVKVDKALDNFFQEIDAKSKEALAQGPKPPKYHRWKTLRSNDFHQEYGYGLYTYVLFNREPIICVDSPDICDRYEKILSAILGSTPSEKKAKLRVSNNEVNIFYIPSHEPDETFSKDPIKYYAFETSMGILEVIGDMLRRHEDLVGHFKRAGPFLITTGEPIFMDTNYKYQEGIESKDSKIPVLFTDLSDTAPELMSEFMRVYKNYITSKPVDKVKNFYPLRLKIMNTALILDDNLKIIKTALAEWLPKDLK